MRDLDHIFLTRFNLPSGGHESLVRAQEGWLQQRVELFEMYCLPSVLTQTSSNFHWIVYFDPQSPDWLRQRISEWRRNSVLTPIYRATVVRTEMHGDILSTIGKRGGDLLTTNLDNDDGLASDFVERLQAAHFLVRLTPRNRLSRSPKKVVPRSGSELPSPKVSLRLFTLSSRVTVIGPFRSGTTGPPSPSRRWPNTTGDGSRIPV